jgi:hypothetical protein
MVSAAVACLPAAVSLLLLEALFMQISGVSLALTSPWRLCLLRVLLCRSLCYKLSPFQAHWERWHYTCIVRPACLFTVHVGAGSSPLSCGVFLPPPLSQAFLLLITGQCCCSCQLPCLFTIYVGSGSSLLSCGVFLPPPLSQAFPLLVAGHTTLLPPEPLWPAWLVYLQSREGFPSPNVRHSVRSTLFPTCLCCSYCLLLSFSFFPQVGVSLSRGLCCSGPGLSVGVPRYHEAHLVCVFPSRLGAGDWRPGALLVSLFNVKWRFSALAGGVEGSNLCLFSVIMPAKCVSSISPRFHYRRLAFCFLPLATILESVLDFSNHSRSLMSHLNMVLTYPPFQSCSPTLSSKHSQLNCFPNPWIEFSSLDIWFSPSFK